MQRHGHLSIARCSSRIKTHRVLDPDPTAYDRVDWLPPHVEPQAGYTPMSSQKLAGPPISRHVLLRYDSIRRRLRNWCRNAGTVFRVEILLSLLFVAVNSRGVCAKICGGLRGTEGAEGILGVNKTVKDSLVGCSAAFLQASEGRYKGTRRPLLLPTVYSTLSPKIHTSVSRKAPK
jgi:hypothetical protein